MLHRIFFFCSARFGECWVWAKLMNIGALVLWFTCTAITSHESPTVSQKVCMFIPSTINCFHILSQFLCLWSLRLAFFLQLDQHRPRHQKNTVVPPRFTIQLWCPGVDDVPSGNLVMLLFPCCVARYAPSGWRCLAIVVFLGFPTWSFF